MLAGGDLPTTLAELITLASCIDIQFAERQLQSEKQRLSDFEEGDEWNTAFNTRDGYFEYLVMPFGLCTTTAVFQEFINDIFHDLLYLCMVVYLDNILVLSTDKPQRHARLALTHLRENCLYTKLKKCLFERTGLLCLCYVIFDRGLLMDLEKQSAVLNRFCSVGLCAI